MDDGSRHEYAVNAAEQRRYILTFGRDGTYQRSSEIEAPFRVQQLGMFPSGTFLAVGEDEKDDSPKLAILKQDGTLLKLLQPSKGDVPESVVGKGDGKYPGFVAPAQLVPSGSSILIVQGSGNFPLLEVSQGGAIRAVRPSIQKDATIKAVLPSDRNLYVVAGPASAPVDSEGDIYELRADDGALLRRFVLSDGRTPSDVACIHDQKVRLVRFWRRQNHSSCRIGRTRTSDNNEVVRAKGISKHIQRHRA